ncbi:MAG: ATP-binding cassette domain-containing protein, partial [Actinobacteria bacterium]
MPEPLLSVDNLSAGYGRVEVLRDVSIAVGEGELVALIGANGAGKSTLLKAIVGLAHVSRGAIRYAGSDVTGTSPERLVRRGLALVPEGRLLFGPLSVAENLELGTCAVPRSQRRRALAEGFDRVHALFPVLAERSRQPASTLSGGEQQMLAVARALMSG